MRDRRSQSQSKSKIHRMIQKSNNFSLFKEVFRGRGALAFIGHVLFILFSDNDKLRQRKIKVG